jgi:hypothetical protein
MVFIFRPGWAVEDHALNRDCAFRFETISIDFWVFFWVIDALEIAESVSELEEEDSTMVTHSGDPSGASYNTTKW